VTKGSRGREFGVPASAEAAEDDLGCIPLIGCVRQDPTSYIDSVVDGCGERVLRCVGIVGIDGGQGSIRDRRVLEEAAVLTLAVKDETAAWGLGFSLCRYITTFQMGSKRYD
jgi:hypothetical protein